MTAIVQTPASRSGGALRELRHRQPTLFRFGALCLALALFGGAAMLVDPRRLGDVPLWFKPTKFFLSIGVFALTGTWFFGLVRPEQRTRPAMRATVATLICAGGFELAYITLQAARGQASHFNVGDPFHALMYQFMGLFAVLLIGTTLPLAWEIAQRPVAGTPSDYRLAVVLGLVMTFLLGGGIGGFMAAQPGHAIGTEAGHLPLFGWNRSGGDLRVAHFLGTHAEQMLPAVAAAGARLGLPARRGLIVGAAAGWAVLTILVFIQALAGAPFPLG